jgi:O-methyltransferase domain
MPNLLEVDETTATTAQAAVIPSPLEQIFQLLVGKHITYALSAVATLGVADHLSAEPLPIEDLAFHVGAQPDFLYRVMRMLASLGVFVEAPGRGFALTPISECLKTDAPVSLRYLAMAWGDQWSTRAFERFTDAVRTGIDATTLAWGKNTFELFADIPEQAETFHRAMTGLSKSAGAAVTDAYDFSQINRLCDVGGGHGMLLASIMKTNPALHGVLFDLPEVVAGATNHKTFEGLEDRVTIESGNFFERVPAACDAYILKHIIHDWDDTRSQRILSLIREQLPANGRVLLCELVVPDSPGPAPAKFLDLEMLALTVGGKERTVEEFKELFASAGLKLTRVIPTTTPFCIIEAVPAS